MEFMRRLSKNLRMEKVMDKAQFLEELQGVLETEDELEAGMSLEGYNYDSLTILGLMSIYEMCSIDIPIDDYEDFKTIGDLINVFESKNK